MNTAHLLENVMIVLVTAVLIVPVFRHLRLSAVLGYLTAGAVIGPYGIGLIRDPEATAALGEFGVIFLLFTLGLELSAKRLRTMRRNIFGLGAAQVVVTGLVLGTAARLIGLPVEAAIIVGAGLALSSTAVTLQLMTDDGSVASRLGRLGLAVLLFQDLAVAPMLAVVPLLAKQSLPVPLSMLLAVAKAAAALTAIYFIGRWLLRPVFRIVAGSGSRELFAGAAILIALGTGWATHEVGLSMALGAFLAGLMLAGTEYRHQVEADIEPFRGILMGLFFMTVGMMIDLSLVAREVAVIAALLLGLLTVKALLLIALARAFGVPAATAVRVGLLLAQGGEFAFVIFSLALGQGLMEPGTVQVLVVVVALSMAVTPLLSTLGKQAAAWTEHRSAVRADGLGDEAEDLTGHVIIAGFGRVGQTVAHLLAREDVSYIALDLDAGRVAAAKKAGLSVVYGNASRADILRLAGAGRAGAVIVTLDQPDLAERTVAVLRQDYPTLPIVARSRDREHAVELRLIGATLVVPELLEASLQLGRAVLKTIGIEQADSAWMMERLRDHDYAALDDIIPPGRRAG